MTFFEKAGPAFEAYGAGDHEGALATFMSAVSPLAWVTIEEVASGEWGIGGKALHTSDIVDMRTAGQ